MSALEDRRPITPSRPPWDLYNEAREFTKALAEKPTEALSTLLAARSVLHFDHDSYLERIGVEFEHLL